MRNIDDVINEYQIKTNLTLKSKKISINKLLQLEKYIKSLNKNKYDKNCFKILEAFYFCKIGNDKYKSHKEYDEFNLIQENYEKNYFKNFVYEKFLNNLTNTDLQRNEIRLNILIKEEVDFTDGREENPFFRDYKTCLIPVVVDCYCDKSIDVSKIYTVNEIIKLTENKNMIVRGCYSSSSPKNELTLFDSINFNNEYINVEGVDYKTSDCKVNGDYKTIYNLEFPDLYNIADINNKRIFGSSPAQIINYYNKLYPNLKILIVEEILQTIPTQIKNLKQEAKEEILKLNQYCENVLNYFQQTIINQNQKVENIKNNSAKLEKEFEI